MLFKTINMEGEKFSTNLVATFGTGFNGLFNKIGTSFKKLITNLNSSASNVNLNKFSESFNSAGFSEQLKKDTSALTSYAVAVKKGVAPGIALKQNMDGISDSCLALMQSENVTSKTIYDYINAQKLQQVSNIAMDKSFSNCKSLIYEYNTALGSANGLTEAAKVKQEELVTAIGVSNDTLGKYLAQLNGAPGSLSGYISYLVKAKAATIALRAATMVLNMAFSMVLAQVAMKIVSGLSDMANAAENAAEEAADLATEMEEVAEASKEEYESVQELIEKYKELKSQSYIDADTRAEILDIQEQITDAVGTQADNLDLVNGKLDEELTKLEEISAAEAKQAADDAAAAYNAAVNNSENAIIGESSFGQTLIYSGDVSDEEYEALKKAIYNASTMGGTNQSFIQDIDEWLNDGLLRIGDYTRFTLSGLNTNGSSSDIDFVKKVEKLFEQYYADYDSSDLWTAIYNIIDEYDTEYADEQYEKAQELLSAKVIENTSNEDVKNIVVDSIDDLEEYRQALVSAIYDDSSIKDAIANGDLTKEGIDSYVQSYIASLSDFEDYYEDWYAKYINTTEESASTEATAYEKLYAVYGSYRDHIMSEDYEPIGTKTVSDLVTEFSEWYDSLSDYNKDILYEIALDTDTADWELSDWQKALETSTQEVYDSTIMSSAETVEQANTTMTDAFSELQEAYTDMLEDGFDMSNTDFLSSCDSIKSALEDVEEEVGTFDYTAYDNFVEVVSDSESSADDVQDAFQDLANSITEAALTGTEDFSTLVAILDSFGIDNAELVAFDALINNTEALTAYGIDLATATDAEMTAFVNETVSAENASQALAALKIQKILLNDEELTIDDIDSLYAYAQAAGASAEALAYLKQLKEDYENSEFTTIPISDSVKESLESLFNTEIDWSKWGTSAGDSFSSSFISSFQDVFSTLYSSGSITSGTGTYKLGTEDLLSTIESIKSLAGEIGEEIDYESLLTSGNMVEDVNDLVDAYADWYVAQLNISDEDFADALSESISLTAKAQAAVESTTDSLSELKDCYADLKDIVAQYNQYGYITIDQLNTLLEMSDEYVACLIDENGQLQLNSEAYIALAKVRLEDARATALATYEDEVAQIRMEALERQAQALAETMQENLVEAVENTTKGFSVFEEQLYSVGKAAELISSTLDTLGGTPVEEQEDTSWIDEEAEAALATAEAAYETRLKLIDEVFDNLESSMSGIFDYDGGSSASTSSNAFDWIEIKFDRLQRKVSNFADAASSAFKTFTSRISSSKSEISALTDEISAQQSAYNEYMEAANAVNLSSSLKAMVRNGSIDISYYDDETKALIEDYQTWYEKALSCSDAITELKESIAECYQEQFDVIVAKWEGKLQDLEHTAAEIESRISQRTDAASDYVSTSQSQSASKSNIKDYKSLISNANSQISKLESEIDELQSYLDSAVASGYIAKYSEAYYDMLEQIQSVEEEIDSLNEEIIGYTNDIAEEYENIFDSIAQEYENSMSMIESEVNLINELINQAEEKGLLESKTYYEELMKLEEENISQLESELADLQTALKNALNSGAIEEGSQAFYDMQDSINSVVEELAEANTELLELSNNIRQIEWDNFDYLQDQISVLTDEADFLIDLLESADLYTDNGQLTNEGLSVMGLHAQNYNVYMNQADQYAEEMAEIQALMEDDPYNTDLIERYQELLGLQQDMILAAEDEKEAIVDLVEEGIETELDALQDLIDSYTDALDSAKDYRNCFP